MLCKIIRETREGRKDVTKFMSEKEAVKELHGLSDNYRRSATVYLSGYYFFNVEMPDHTSAVYEIVDSEGKKL